MGWLSRLRDAFFGREKLTEAAQHIGNIFDTEVSVGQAFFDALLARFTNFDEYNAHHENKAFYEDVDFITQCFNESFKSEEELKRFGERIDAYLYVYARIKEYFQIIEEKHYGISALRHNVKQLREAIISNASKIFIHTNGLQPNLCTTDRDLLKRMNIDSYRLEITTIDENTIIQFFCFCKLSLAASLLFDPGKPLQWKAIISDIKYFKISLEDLVKKYLDFKAGFEDFPLDVPGFTEFISRVPLFKATDKSPLNILLELGRSLKLKLDEFLNDFLPIFQNQCRNKLYKMNYVGEFLGVLAPYERYFSAYLSAYTACVDTDTLWRLFLYLCQISELNEPIKKHLLLKVTDRVSNINLTTFFDYTNLADKSMNTMEEEKRVLFREVYRAIFNTFIIHQLTDEHYRYKYFESYFEKLLNILTRYSSSIEDAAKEPSFSLIIQNMLFSNENNHESSKQKLKNLVDKLNRFNKEILDSIDPKDVIRNEWIQDFLLFNDPQDFENKLDVGFYRDLCKQSEKNPWIIYTWDRILNLSFMKPAFQNTKEVLVKLNRWMEIVKHDRYNKDDIFTIIFISQLFNQVVSRYTKSVLSLPKIENIMNFILSLRDQNNGDHAHEEMSRFIAQAERSISNVLKLQGKLEKII